MVNQKTLTVADIVPLFESNGHVQYGGEAVSQLEHGLQAAFLAEKQGAPPQQIVAALLHDIGHLLHDLPADAADHGIDDHHENSGGHALNRLFPPAVTEPVRLHVAAKRYLVTVDDNYQATLSAPSVVSLNLQGGKMSPDEVAEFEANPFHQQAVELRKWDDEAKVAGLKTPPLSHFEPLIHQVRNGDDNGAEN